MTPEVEDAMSRGDEGRTIGLLGATGIGVGAIVGGGILALAGVAFAVTGPAAMLAFGLNGVIALVTALSFAEMSTAFPESGGTYTFAKKVLSVQAAFTVGWIVWFASIVAAVLYALGFGLYGATAIESLWTPLVGGAPPAWLHGRWPTAALALVATAFYTAGLTRRGGGGGQWATAGKIVVFAILIAGGAAALVGRPLASVGSSLRPFFAAGAIGLVQAMGYTFIALQGFDLIAAVAGEVREPGRTIPRAMFLSLAAALLVYLPLLFVVATVGVAPGESITAASAADPETIIAIAAKSFLGSLGYWLVIVAALLSMLSALQANLFAASRVALAMARDRTLPRLLGRIHPTWGTPLPAVLATALAVALIIVVVPDVAAAGAAASLIFLISFAMAHWMTILARRRSAGRRAPFRVPWFPYLPLGGGMACLGLAVFQGVAVPSAGLITSAWLAAGAVLFLSLLARRARVFDASAEALDPYLVQLRGRSPLVLVPIANPANAAAMVTVASALAPPAVGRVLLLFVVRSAGWEPDETPRVLRDAQSALQQALEASLEAGMVPEALTTVAPRPWTEIGRVAQSHRCASLLLGLRSLAGEESDGKVEDLMSEVDCDVVILRAPPGWQLSSARRVLVPIAGARGQDVLRARLLGSLCRTAPRQVCYLQVLRPTAPDKSVRAARRLLAGLAEDEVPGGAQVEVARNESVAAEVTRHAAEHDLVILGLQRLGRRQKGFGSVALRIARDTSSAIIMISRRG